MEQAEGAIYAALDTSRPHLQLDSRNGGRGWPYSRLKRRMR
jgi:hypothetical protein